MLLGLQLLTGAVFLQNGVRCQHKNGCLRLYGLSVSLSRQSKPWCSFSRVISSIKR